jgi:protein-disulfide isomerase
MANQFAPPLPAPTNTPPWWRQTTLWVGLVVGAAVTAAAFVIVGLVTKDKDAGPQAAPTPTVAADASALPSAGPTPDTAVPVDPGSEAQMPQGPLGATPNGGIAIGTDGLPGGPAPQGKDVVTVDVVSDYICPWCDRFEEEHGAELKDKALAGEIQLVLHPMGYLDQFSTTEYSTRAANAAAVVADQSPEHFLAFHEALFANQPAEGGPGLSDEELAELARSLGVDSAVTDQFSQRPFADWVRAATAGVAGVEGFSGTPWILLSQNGGPMTVYDNWTERSLDDAIATFLASGSGSSEG